MTRTQKTTAQIKCWCCSFPFYKCSIFVQGNENIQRKQTAATPHDGLKQAHETGNVFKSALSNHAEQPSGLGKNCFCGSVSNIRSSSPHVAGEEGSCLCTQVCQKVAGQKGDCESRHSLETRETQCGCKVAH